MSPVLAAALSYLRAGLRVVPLARETKRPLVAWKAFQERHATEAEVRDWFPA
jgi:hypothetical protein